MHDKESDTGFMVMDSRTWKEATKIMDIMSTLNMLNKIVLKRIIWYSIIIS